MHRFLVRKKGTGGEEDVQKEKRGWMKRSGCNQALEESSFCLCRKEGRCEEWRGRRGHRKWLFSYVIHNLEGRGWPGSSNFGSSEDIAAS